MIKIYYLLLIIFEISLLSRENIIHEKGQSERSALSLVT
jgi:hypothetical protein